MDNDQKQKATPSPLTHSTILSMYPQQRVRRATFFSHYVTHWKKYVTKNGPFALSLLPSHYQQRQRQTATSTAEDSFDNPLLYSGSHFFPWRKNPNRRTNLFFPSYLNVLLGKQGFYSTFLFTNRYRFIIFFTTVPPLLL